MLYARCQRIDKINGAIFNNDKHFKKIDWLPDNGELILLGVKAIPGYSLENPYIIAVNYATTKL